MGPVWLRLTVALLYVLAWCAPFYVEAASVTVDWGSDGNGISETLFLVIAGVVTLLTGLVVGWPSLALPFVIGLALDPLGTHPEDSDGWTYVALYVIPLGFLSFFVLLAASLVALGVRFWRPRKAQAVQSPRPEVARMSERWLLLVPGAVLAVAVVLLLVLLSSATSTEARTATVRIDEMLSNPPAASTTELPLKVTAADGCGSPEDEVTGLGAEETARSIVITASVEIQREFPCYRGPVRLSALLPLQRPLGERVVVDDSSDERIVIWTPEAGARFRRLSSAEAERFLLSKRAGSDAKCFRANDRYFDCTYRRADTGRRSFVILTVMPSGELALGPK